MRHYRVVAITMAPLILTACRADPNNPDTQARMLVGEWRLIDSRLIDGDQAQPSPGVSSTTQRFTSDGTLIWSPASQAPYRIERRDDGYWIVTEVTTGHLQSYGAWRFRIVNDVLFTYDIHGLSGGVFEKVYVRATE